MNLVKQIQQYIVETSIRPQEDLALGAALGLVSVLKAHREQTETGLRSNLYLLGLGESGTGKEHPLRAVKEILKQISQELLLIGEPASDSGLLKSLEMNQGKGLLLWDEFGYALSSLTDARSGAHYKKVLSIILKLFSSANSLFVGKEYANFDGKASRRDLDQPCLSVYATTTPDRFTGALDSALVIDGFLPRWLLFTAERAEKQATVKPLGDVPREILDACLEILTKEMNATPRGNLDFALRINPREVKLSPEAKEEVSRREISFYLLEQALKIDSRDKQMLPILVRLEEHMYKLALVIAMGDKISRSDIQMAGDIVIKSFNLLDDMVKNHVSDSQIEKLSKRVERIIKDAGEYGLSQREISNKTRFLTRAQRNELLGGLTEAGVIYTLDSLSGNGDRKRKVTYYLHKQFGDKMLKCVD